MWPAEENSARELAAVPPSGIITLLTDFGNADGYVAAMKGVMLSLNPAATIIDLSHEIGAQNIAAGALLLAAHYQYFPRGTVHVAIVDPEVGTARTAVACAFDGHYFVAPDNGLLDFCCESRAGLFAVKLNRPQYWRQVISNTFHGRDLFAPVAAHLTLGTPLSQLGERMPLAPRRRARKSRIENDALIGEVVYIDHFGNLISNISAEEFWNFCGGGPFQIRVAGLAFDRLHPSYGFAAPGAPLALLDSFARLEIGVNQGHAAKELGIALGAPIIIARGQQL